MRSLRPVRAVATLLLLGLLAASGSASYGSYTVQAGDTLWTLARRFGVSVDSLADRNGISNVHHIRSGSQLQVPGSSGATSSGSSSSSGPVRIVQPGETLLEISIETGVLMRSIAAANQLRSYDHIYAGQRLTIPDAGATSTSTSADPAPAVSAPPVDASREEVGALIDRIAGQYGFSPRFIKAIAMMESGWNNDVVSSAGAVGIMQVLPSTGEFVSKYLVGRPLDLRDPADNVTAGTAYVAYLWRLTGGDVDKTLAGYYQGLRSVSQRGMYPSTKHYVRTILSLRDRY